MPKPIVIDFTVSAEDVIARLCHRRQCPKCGKVFSIDDATLARGEVRCDQDGAKLAQRADDNPEAIRERLRLYSQNVANLVSYYRPGAYHLVRATRTPAEIAREVLALLNQEWSAHLAGVQVGATTQSMYRI